MQMLNHSWKFRFPYCFCEIIFRFVFAIYKYLYFFVCRSKRITTNWVDVSSHALKKKNSSNSFDKDVYSKNLSRPRFEYILEPRNLLGHRQLCKSIQSKSSLQFAYFVIFFIVSNESCTKHVRLIIAVVMRATQANIFLLLFQRVDRTCLLQENGFFYVLKLNYVYVLFYLKQSLFLKIEDKLRKMMSSLIIWKVILFVK